MSVFKSVAFMVAVVRSKEIPVLAAVAAEKN
jgi:hypothetical protein